MKAILMSIRPEWVAKILNGEKTIEIRKKFPKDYVGWVYIYCTKAHDFKDEIYLEDFIEKPIDNRFGKSLLNGKVIARFWCDKVEEIKRIGCGFCKNETEPWWFLEDKSCLTYVELKKYLNDYGYAIHITKLEIFDKPKEIKEFYKVGCEEYFTKHVFVDHPNFRPIYESELKQFQLTRAPQSYCFIEV